MVSGPGTGAQEANGIELAVGNSDVLSTSTDQTTCESYRKLAEKNGVALETDLDDRSPTLRR